MKKHLVVTIGLSLGLAGFTSAAERPTCNKDTCDPRPDILPYWMVDCQSNYRREFNRPRYVAGWLAHVIEPTSQEAMVWCEAKQLGLYDKPHTPPLCRYYYAPKPWERLQTGPRPDTKMSVASTITQPSRDGDPTPRQSVSDDSTTDPSAVRLATEYNINSR